MKGKVEKELSLSLDALTALGTSQWQAEHPKEGMLDVEGVLLRNLLQAAGVQAGATEAVVTWQG